MVVLPVPFEGGELVCRHAGQEARFALNEVGRCTLKSVLKAPGFQRLLETIQYAKRLSCFAFNFN